MIDPSVFVERIHEGGGDGLGFIGAIIGGIGALMFPGGLVFFAGAALGGLDGNSVGGGQGGGEVRRVFDALGFKRKMMSKIQVSLDSMKKKMIDGIRKTATKVSSGVLLESEERLDRIRTELKRITEKCHNAEADRVATGKTLDAQEKNLLGHKKC